MVRRVDSPDDDVEHPPSRRRFLGWLTAGFGAAIAAVVGGPPLVAALSPIRRHGADFAFVPVASLDSLEIGVPRRFPVVTDAIDAWEKRPRERVGSVWLIRKADGTLSAFSATCPHAGCQVDLSPKGAAAGFLCPCHGSRFTEAGARISGPTPRGLDPLETRVKKGEVSVRWVRFRMGTSNREAV